MSPRHAARPRTMGPVTDEARLGVLPAHAAAAGEERQGPTPTGEHADPTFAEIYRRGDRWMALFVAFHTVLALALAPVHDSWRSTAVVTTLAAGAFFVAAWRRPGSLLTRIVAGLALQAFCALHIHQMRGLAEMHFFFFTSTTALVIYQDWRAIWPGVVAIIAQHTLFSYWHNVGVRPGGHAFFEPTVVGPLKLGLHYGIALAQTGIASYWAVVLRRRTLRASTITADLAASEARFRALFERAAVGMGRVGFAHARWLEVNDAFCAMLGYSREAMLATPWPEITHPEDVDLDLVPFRRMAAGELDAYTVEKRFVHARGHHVWARLTLSLVRDAAGRPDYEIAVIEDITARRQIEAERERGLEAERIARVRVDQLQQLTAALSAARSPQAVMEAALTAGTEIAGTPRGAVYRLDTAGPAPALVQAAVHGFDATAAEWRRIPLDAPIPAADAVARRAPVVIANRAEFAQRYPHLGPVLEATGIHGTSAFPLLAGRDAATPVLGFIAFDFDEDREAAVGIDHSILFLGAVARLTGSALDRALAYERAEEARAEVEATNAHLQDQQIELELSNQQLQELATELERRTQALQATAAELAQRREAAERREAELATVLERLPAAVWIADAGGRITRVNPGVAALWGGAPMLDATGEYVTYEAYWPPGHPRAGARVASEEWALARVLATGETVLQEPMEIVRFDTGERRQVLNSGAAIRNAEGRVTGGVAVMFDVTEQEATRQALEEARAEADAERRRLALVLDRLPVGVVVVAGATGAVVHYNPALEAVLGHPVHPAADVSGYAAYGGLHADGRPYAPEDYPVARALLHGEVVLQELTRYRRGDGEEVTLSISAAPVRDEAGAIAYAVAAVEDVDERERARATAEEANRAKSEFLAVMSHELRTPLNAIGGHVQLMEMGLHGTVTEAQREALGRVNRAQRHLLRVINDVLNFAKIEAGAVEYDLRPVLVADVVRDVTPMLAPLLAAKGHALAVDLPEDRGEPPILVQADPEKLGQVLLNLLSNAVKFTPEGGRITVALGTGAASRQATAGDAGDASVPLVVRDTGIGIPAEKRERIFEPFVQVDSALTREHEGTGLGLAISRDLARGMGGELVAESIEGGGAAFIVTLRRAAASGASGVEEQVKQVRQVEQRGRAAR